MSSYCFICHGSIRLIGPLTLEEATKELFELKQTFEGLYIEIIDEKTGRVLGRIPRRG